MVIKQQRRSKTDTPQTKVSTPAGDTLSIVAVGDLMPGTSYPNKNTLPPDSGRNSFKHALNYLRNADVAFGNLEGVLLDTGAAIDYKLRSKNKTYLFRIPTAYGALFKDAGFDALSLGNNHTNDFAAAGRKSTAKILDSLGISYAGLKTHPAAIFTIKGIRYGFCAFSPNSQTASLVDIKGAKNLISDLKSKCDIVVVSFHGGAEGVTFEHVPPGDESYNGEYRGNVRLFTHAAVDAGADFIFGHGPHVVRGMEIYNKRLIAYSLGNFCTHSGVSVLGICGLAPLLKITLNKKGEFLNGQIISYRQTHDKGTLRDTLNRAALRIKMLTDSDFTAPGLSISSLGVITPLRGN